MINKKHKIIWNKGLTKETDERIKRVSLEMKLKMKGKHYSPKTEIKKGMIGEKSIAWKGGKTKCIDCGAELSKRGIKRCRKCSDIFYIGEKTNNWQGGKSFEPYSVDWTETLKRAIRERDNYICQLCSQYGNNVHHKDYDKKNCNPDNLITLCIGCNSKVNFNREYWIKYFNLCQS